MAAVPTVERPPAGLSSYWLGVWRAALAQLKEDGLWAPAQKPHLDAYVRALMNAELHRELAEERPFSHSHATDRDFVHPGFTSADRERKAAIQLADMLGLSAKAQKAFGRLGGGEDVDDPFRELDELEQRRQARAS